MDSDDDDSSVKSPGASSIMSPSPTLKVEQDPGSNEFVNVIAPEEEEMAGKGPEIEAKTLSAEEIPKPVEELPKSIPYNPEKAPPVIDNDADTNAPIFTNEMPLQREPESMSEAEQTVPPGVGGGGGDDDEPKMPGSFDMSTAHPQKQTTWMEMLKNLGL